MRYYLSVWKKSFTIEGRARRKEFFAFSLINFLVTVVLAIAATAATAANPESGLSLAMTVIYVLFAIAVIIPSWAVSIRRLHDINRSGWWVLITFVPFLGLIFLVFMFLDSHPHENEYGVSPKYTE